MRDVDGDPASSNGAQLMKTRKISSDAAGKRCATGGGCYSQKPNDRGGTMQLTIRKEDGD